MSIYLLIIDRKECHFDILLHLRVMLEKFKENIIQSNLVLYFQYFKGSFATFFENITIFIHFLEVKCPRLNLFIFIY